jgi:hypothetical protein
MTGIRGTGGLDRLGRIDGIEGRRRADEPVRLVDPSV